MSAFVLEWDADKEVPASNQLPIHELGDDALPEPPEELFVVSQHHGATHLRARLIVTRLTREPAHGRAVIHVAHPRTAFFAQAVSDAPQVRLPAPLPRSGHRRVVAIDEHVHAALTRACGDYDFGHRRPPPAWPGIAANVEQAVRRLTRDGDDRSAVLIAAEYLRENYYTTQLVGPSPVYVTSAGYALGMLAIPAGPAHSPARAGTTRSPVKSRATLDDRAIEAGINEDAGHFLTTPPDSRRHQEILARLRDRLLSLGLAPMYDGYVDCIVELAEADVYFEVKSASSPSSFEHQLRLAVGQVGYYRWRDRELPHPIAGWIVIEDQPVTFDAHAFVASLGLRLLLDSEIDKLEAGELVEPPTAAG